MMIKLRYISLLLVFALFISLSSPASAATNSFLIDLKSYELGLYSLDFDIYWPWQFRGSSGELYFSLPDYSSFAYVDIIFTIIDGDPGLISFSVNGSNLTAEFFGNNFIRVYGAVDYSDYEFPLYIDSDSTFLASVSSFQYSEFAPGLLEPSVQYLYLGSNYYSWDYPDSFVLQNTNVGSFSYSIAFDNWQAYDFLDFSVQLSPYEITSMSVYIDEGQSVPFTHSFVGGSGTFENNNALISFGIDLSGLDRSLGSRLWIEIDGSFGPYPVSFRAFSAGAFVRVNSSASSAYWFQKIIDDISFEISSWFEELVIGVCSWGSTIVDSISSWGSNIVDTISLWGENLYNALIGDPDQDNPLTDGGELDQETDDLRGSLDIIDDNLQKPDISDVDLIPVDPSGFLEPTYGYWVTLLIGEGSPFNAFALISVTFMLGSYVLFGKRR